MTRAAPVPEWVTEAVAELNTLSTVAETAKFLRCHERTVMRAIAAGHLSAVRATDGAPHTLVPKSSLARYLAERAA